MHKNLHNSKKSSNFAPAFQKKACFGRLDERLSQRSAKPFRAV